eukprot:8639040-Alexandrium_andersonii.AAC.1
MWQSPEQPTLPMTAEPLQPRLSQTWLPDLSFADAMRDPASQTREAPDTTAPLAHAGSPASDSSVSDISEARFERMLAQQGSPSEPTSPRTWQGALEQPAREPEPEQPAPRGLVVDPVVFYRYLLHCGVPEENIPADIAAAYAANFAVEAEMAAAEAAQAQEEAA